jgi:hypothetical protein
MTRSRAITLTVLTSAAAFCLGFYLQLNAAYGPFNLSWHPGDWLVLWELWRAGQIAPQVVIQAGWLGLAAAAIPWVIGWRRCRQTHR